MSAIQDRKVIQFQLWEECNSRCVYCFEGDDNRNTSIELKLSVLRSVIDCLKSDKIKKYQVVSYIGGEIFQGQLNTKEVRDLFFEAIQITRKLYDEGTIKSVWFCASMMVGKNEDLYKTLDYFKDCEDIWVATSYDTLHRFKTEKMFHTWENHIAKIHKEYPKIKLNTTMILTQDLMEKYLSGEFSFNEFSKKYNTKFYIKPPVPFVRAPVITEGEYDSSLEIKEKSEQVLPKFFPKKETALEFFIKYKQEEGKFLFDKLFNVNMRADTYLENRKANGKTMINITREKTGNKLAESLSNTLSCGHSVYYQSYGDCDDCILCDKISISNLVI